MTEIWKPIPGHPNYEASSLGRIRSTFTDPPRVKKLTPRKRDGYLRTGIGGGQPIEVHRLVATAFLGPRPTGLVTRHIDGDQTNNRPDNLAYGTVSENRFDAVRHGTDRNARKTECIHGHPFDAANTYISPKGARACRACVRATQARRRRRMVAA